MRTSLKMLVTNKKAQPPPEPPEGAMGLIALDESTTIQPDAEPVKDESDGINMEK